MNISVTSVLSRLVLEQNDNLSELLSIAATEKKSGDPLAVRLKPAVREYVKQVSLKLGISSSEFINILIEGVIRETLSPFQVKSTQLLERFQLVMDAHGLSITDIAKLLSPWNIGLSVLESRERTMDYLTSEVISEISSWFGLSKDWLQKGTLYPVISPRDFMSWQGLAIQIKDKISANANGHTPEIVLYRDDLAHPVDMYSNDTLVGVCLTYHRKVNGIVLRIVEYFGDQDIYGQNKLPFQEFMTFCGYLFRNGTANIRTWVINTSLFELLSYGRILPVMAVDKMNSEPTVLSWQTEEIQPLLLPEQYASEEWLKNIKDIIKDI